MKTYGDILRYEREKNGISLHEVSDELHVREDIVSALENGDFSQIPPQGYSRNMVKSYARLLGLNTRKMTEMFLDAEYSYRIGKQRRSQQQISDENRKLIKSKNRNSSFQTPRQHVENRNMSENKNNSNSSSKNSYKKGSLFSNREMHTFSDQYANSPRARRERDQIDNENKGGRSLRNPSLSRISFSDDNYELAKKRLEARRKKSRDSLANQSDTENISGFDQVRNTREANQRRRKWGSTERNVRSHIRGNQLDPSQTVSQRANFQYMHVYNGNKPVRNQRFPIPVIAGIVVVLVIILILVLFFVGRHEQNAKTDVSNVSVTGLTDPEKNANFDNQDNNNETIVQSEPKEAEFKYKVKDGNSAYIEIYENDSTTPIMSKLVNGGETGTYKVTSKLTFVTTSPDAVVCTVNDATVQPVDQNGTGVYSYTVDFQQILKDWQTKNGKSTSSNSLNQSGTNNNATSSGGSSSGSSSSNSSSGNSSSGGVNSSSSSGGSSSRN